MASHYRHRRNTVATDPVPTLETGEIAVNTANRQIALGGPSGPAKPLIAVRYFDVTAQYAVNDFVAINGLIYAARVAISPGPFDVTKWHLATNDPSDPTDLSNYLLLTGGTLTGPLFLAADPLAGPEAATKHYVDDFVATYHNSHLPPVPPVPTAAQIASTPVGTVASTNVQAAIGELDAEKLPLLGGVMLGMLSLFADPVAVRDAATKQYVDAAVAAIPPPFPSGTVMLFYQASAPTGWTKLTSQNDKALRVVSGAGGVAGGTNSFSSVMAQSVVGNHTLNTGEIPPGIQSGGTNTITVYPFGNGGIYMMATDNSNPWSTAGLISAVEGYPVSVMGAPYGNPYAVNYSQGSNTIYTYSQGGGGAHNHPITMAIQYIDVILASKN